MTKRIKGGPRSGAGPRTDLLRERAAVAKDRREVEDALAALDAAENIEVPSPDLDQTEAVLVWYRLVMAQVQNIARHPKLGRDQAPGQVSIYTLMRELWPLLNQARLFYVPPQVFAAVYNWADRYTTEVVAGREWESEPEADFTKEYADRVSEASVNAPFPEHLPFPYSFFIYGQGMDLTEEQMLVTLGPKNIDELDGAKLFGHLVCGDGRVWEFTCGTQFTEDDEGRPVERTGLYIPPVRDTKEWERTLSLRPWYVPGIINIVNSFKTLVREQPRTLRFRKAWKESKKKSKVAFDRPIPPPFYRVELHQELVVETTRKWLVDAKRRTWELKHRCDVRAHERIRVARGSMPIPPDIEEALRERNYRIFTHNALDDETAKLLYERHESPKRAGEWLAVKVSWIRAHQRGPEDAPYVPAIRVVPGGPL